jgi:hypothetical protein
VASHESFWIAVAAAAPVIALAAIVALTDTARAAGLDRYAPDGADPDLIRAAQKLLRSGYAAGLVNIVLQAVTLLLALLSLAAGHDQAPLIVAEITAPFGIFLLFAGGMIAIALRIAAGYIERGGPPILRPLPPRRSR